MDGKIVISEEAYEKLKAILQPSQPKASHDIGQLHWDNCKRSIKEAVDLWFQVVY